MASCSLRTADLKVSRFDVSRGRVSTLTPCSLRNWIGRTPQRYLSLMISHSSRKSLHACCSASPETRTITRSEKDSEETKPSSMTSQLIPNLHEVETLLTSICDTSSIAEFEMKLGGFSLRMVRGLKGENLLLPPAPAPVIQNTSSTQSDSNGSVKTTSLTLFKPEPVSSSSSSSPEGISRFVEKATDEGLAILASPKVGFFRRSQTIKGKRAPPSCEENQVVIEGQVLCYIDQLGAEIPIESDISGKVVKILRKDGEPVGYGDALIAVLPSFLG